MRTVTASLEAPAQGMNQAPPRGRAENPPGTRIASIARPRSRAGRQGKIKRPPGFSVSSQETGGATTPAKYPNAQGHEFEAISLTFQKIDVQHMSGKTEAMDDWKAA